MDVKQRDKAFFSALAAVVLIGSCVTINIYFPAAAVEKAAEKIIEETWGEQEPAREEKAPESKNEQYFKLSRAAVGPSTAYAQEADINVTTPAIRALKESMKQNAESIKPYLEQGVVGIGNDGLLVIRTPEKLKLKEKAGLTRIVDKENSDREALYIEIAKANNFGRERVQDIKKIFAGSWLEKAQVGWFIQNANGTWTKKTPPKKP